MWVKAYIGSWINLDPSFYNDNFSPIHIALAESSLNSLSDRTDMVLKVIKSFSYIKINVLNYSNLDPNTVIKSPDETTPKEFNLLDYIKNGNNPVKRVIKNSNDSVPDSQSQKRSYEGYIKSGYYNFSEGKIDQAIDDFSTALELIPFNNSFSDVELARKLASLGLFNLANNELKNIYDSEIWDRHITNIKRIYYPKTIPQKAQEKILAQAFSKINFQNDPDEAISLINDNHIQLGRSDYTYYLLSEAYLVKNDIKKSISQLEKSIKTNPANLTYHLELAKLLEQNNKFKNAQKEIDYLLNQNITDEKFNQAIESENYLIKSRACKKNSPESLYYLAKYHASKNEFKEVTDILDKLVNKKIKNPDIYTLAGEAYYQMNQPDKSLSYYKIALKYRKDDPYALKDVADIGITEGKFKESLELYNKAERIVPKDIVILLAIADNYKLLSQEDKAYDYYSRILQLNDLNDKANCNVGIMYFNKGEKEKAADYFKKSLSVNYFNTESWLGLAKIELNKKNNFLAKSYLVPVNYIDDNNPDYYYYSGLIDKNNENLTSAKDNFKKAFQLKSDFKEAQQELESLK